MNHKDIWIRSAKTFVQAALAAWAISGNAVTKDAALGAVAAGLAALWNYAKQLKTT